MKTVKEHQTVAATAVKVGATAGAASEACTEGAAGKEGTKPEIHISLAGKYFPNEKSHFGKGTYWYLPIYQRDQLKGLHKRTLYHYLTILRWQPKFIESVKPSQVKEARH